MDIIEFLEDNGVHYNSSGKNISTGWIGIQCFFCDDQSDHLGIRLSDLKCKCWRCGGHSIISVIMEISDCSKEEALKLQKVLVADGKKSGNTLLNPPITKPTDYYWTRSATILPPESTKYLPEIHKEYLKSRNFHPSLIQRRYDIRACHTLGRYKFRIIIPIYQNRRLVSFTSRAIFDEMEPKYLNPKLRIEPIEVSPKQTIYNIDSILIGKDILITEGITNTWRFGDGCVSTQGTEFTKNQILLIIRRKIRNAFIMFDNDRFKAKKKREEFKAKGINKTIRANTAAERRAKELYRIISPFVQHSEIIEPQLTNDLADFSREQAIELRRLLNFNR